MWRVERRGLSKQLAAEGVMDRRNGTGRDRAEPGGTGRAEPEAGRKRTEPNGRNRNDGTERT